MTYKVAVTSSDEEVIDLHFGQASEYLILEVDEESGEYEKLEVRSLDPEIYKNVESDCKGRGPCAASAALLNPISDLLKDCTYLLTAKIGNRPHRGLQQRNIHVMEVPSLPLKDAIAKINKYYTEHKSRESHIF